MLESLVPALVGAGVALLVAFISLTSERARENAPRKRVDAIKSAQEALDGATGVRERQALTRQLRAEIFALERNQKRREPENALLRRLFFCGVFMAISVVVILHLPDTRIEPKFGTFEFWLSYGSITVLGISGMLFMVLVLAYLYSATVKIIRVFMERMDAKRPGEKFFAPGWSQLAEEDWTRG